MSFKVFKDPVYGYINIDSEIVRSIIDTACFQRLRNIRQTSYAPLYPASVHNRFVHSIGVYYLGQKAFDSALKSLDGSDKPFVTNDADNIRRLFCLACLLHDVGHAPFSHTGEVFFLADKKTQSDIYSILKDLIKNDTFSDDFEFYYNNVRIAAPHEIMSCIVSLKTFSEHISSPFERDFFTRCITGFKYRDTSSGDNDILNCFIELLNSPIIDVDRLDYIIRDAQTTGFQSASIDYERLLTSIRIVTVDEVRCLGYHKNALSVIENVVYAHDAERKWIQNHPTILYEDFLIQHAMRSINKRFGNSKSGARFFSYEALTKKGLDFDGKGSISLLADEDILHIMKGECSDPLVDEYFARNTRRHPIWKSEAEYRALFDRELVKYKLDDFEVAFKEVEKYLIDHFSIPIINADVLQHIKEEEDKINRSRDIISAKDYKNLIGGIAKIKKWVLCLQRVADDNNIPFDFTIISANKFKSGFLKQDLEKLLIYFPYLNVQPYIKEVSTVLTSEKTRDSFFYMFFRGGRGSASGSAEGTVISNIASALRMELIT